MHEWETGLEVGGVYSGLIRERLRQSIDVLRELGVEFPPAGRHELAIKLFDRLHEGELQPSADKEQIRRRVQAAQKTAWETYIIAVTAWESRKAGSGKFPPEKLQTITHGDQLGRTSSSIARDTQFELYLAAVFRLGGMDIHFAEPDIQMLFGREHVGVAAKRMTSTKDARVREHASKAKDQIAKSGLRGWIAFNVDARFTNIVETDTERDLLESFNTRLNSVHRQVERYRNYEGVLGFIISGYTSWWAASEEEEQPILRAARPMRWFLWSDDPDERQLFDEFVARWRSGLDTRIKVLSSPEFDGRL